MCDQVNSVNVAMAHSVLDAQQHHQHQQQQQQQLPSNASANQATSASGSVQYAGAINQMHANVWNQGISNQQNQPNFQ